jgi:hypothetical protein
MFQLSERIPANPPEIKIFTFLHKRMVLKGSYRWRKLSGTSSDLLSSGSKVVEAGDSV